MKVIFAIAVALGSFAVAIAPADARKSSSGKGYKSYYSSPQYRYYQPRRGYGHRVPYANRSQSEDCLEASYLDPSGNYAGYPCWAAKAFAPKKQF